MVHTANVILVCSISDDKRDEPHITEEVLHSCIGYTIGYINLLILQSQSRKHNIPEYVFHDILSDTGMTRVNFMLDDEAVTQYILYRLGEIENGFQIFYRCLRETQDVCPGHRILADDLERNGKFSGIFITFLLSCVEAGIAC